MVNGSARWFAYRCHGQASALEKVDKRIDVEEVLYVSDKLTEEQFSNLMHNLRHLESPRTRNRVVRTEAAV